MATLSLLRDVDECTVCLLIDQSAVLHQGTLYKSGRVLSMLGLTDGLNGTHTITGVLSVAGSPAAGTAILIRETDGLPMVVRQIGGDGVYVFAKVPVGLYAIAFVDAAGNSRGKVVHVEVT